MITILGRLVVRTNVGPSKEGLLKCSLGKFLVKSFQLESLNLGEYEGFFTLMKIEPYCRHHQGKFLLELEAVIEKMALISEPSLSSLLPSEETKNAVQLSLLEDLKEFSDESIQTENLAPSKKAYDVDLSLNDDSALFGELFPLQDKVRLDVAQDRQILRQQINRLKQIGYSFDEKNQYWVF